MPDKTTVLLMLDGWGMSDNNKNNAFALAKTPVLDRLMAEYPNARCLSAGISVGLPNGQAGNAEVGYNNIGAGRIVYSKLSRVNKEIAEGGFYNNEAFLTTIDYCKRNDSSLHIMGLLSDGGVHSHIEHLYSLLKLAASRNMRKVYVHCFMDGRDTSPRSGAMFIERLQSRMREYGVGEIASVSGRFYAMDRSNSYDRVKLAYLAMTQGEGNKAANAQEAVQNAYDRGESDEFTTPTVIVNGGVPVGTVIDDDAVIFFNIRTDRAVGLTRAFCEDEFRLFKRESKLSVRFVCFTDYDHSIENKIVAFDDQPVYDTLGEYMERRGIRQLRLTESENSSYVTDFFNCSHETFEGEDRLIIRSLKDVTSYVKAPAMNSGDVTDRLVKEIGDKKYDFILCSLANADIVGHTADIDATVKAVEYVDECVGKIYNAVIGNDAVLFISSTHGNAEKLSDEETEEAYTAHTMNPVPFIMVNESADKKLRSIGCLADITPTILESMGLDKPREMTGKSLIEYSV